MEPAGPVAPRAGVTMSPFGSSAERQKPKRLSVSITKDFVPGRWRFGSSWRAFSDPLSDGRPSGIIKEPHYQGNTQKYGSLSLGTGKNKVYGYVLDRAGNAQPVLYFDWNQNGKIERPGEYIQPGHFFTINGQVYACDICG